MTGSDSAPAKANEAGQKNDIGAAKDDISLAVVNAKMQGMETAYVQNGVSAENASTTVGTEVIKAVAQKYQTNNQIGKATIEIDGFGTVENVTGNATVSVYTTDFIVEGTILKDGGQLSWGEIGPNVPSIVLTVESSTKVAPGGTLQLGADFRKMDSIALENLTWTSSNPNIATVSKSGLVTVDSDAQGGQTVKITATGNGVTSNPLTLTVKSKLTSISIDKSANEEIEKGGTVTITATVEPSINVEDIRFEIISNVAGAYIGTVGTTTSIVQVGTDGNASATISVPSDATENNTATVKVYGVSTGTSESSKVKTCILKVVKPSYFGKALRTTDYGKFVYNKTLEGAKGEAYSTPVEELETGALTTGGWRLLYQNAQNTYIISADVISISDITGINFSTLRVASGSNTSSSTGADIGDVGKWLNPSLQPDTWSENNTWENIKALKYLTDTSTNSVWNTKFKGPNATYAIGGPSVELLIESYNKAKNGSLTVTAGSMDSQEVKQYGYISMPYSANSLGHSDEWVIGENNKDYWLASPSGETNRTNYLLNGMSYDRSINRKDVGYINGSVHPGVRPLICIPTTTFNSTYIVE